MTAHLKTPLSSSWSLQKEPHWSASSRTVTSLLTDRRLRSWLSGAVLTTWSLTRSKQWRWFGFLGTTISQDLKWDNHIESIVKKAQQRLYFLRQLRKFNLPMELLKQFYSAIIESVLCTSITVWFSSATKSDLRRLRRVVPSHPAHSLFDCYRLVDATELWAPDRPATETVSSLKLSISWTLDNNVEHTTLLYIIFLTHILIYISKLHISYLYIHNCL